MRVNKILIHKVSYATNRGDNTIDYYHTITTGDFGIPLLTGIGIWIEATIGYYVFTPLRWIEKIFWILYPRDYKSENASLLPSYH
jgi:hypothetical protein